MGVEADLFDFHLNENQTIKRTKVGRGRIGKDTEFKEQIVIDYTIEWSVKEEEVEKKSRIDGIFPLVTNTALAPVDVLKKYKEQPYLEKRFNTFKSITEVAPMFLKLPHRIEAMLFLYFIALMIIALIEREIHRNMVEEATQKAPQNSSDEEQEVMVEVKVEKLPILPQKMNTTKPTWNNIRYFFDQVFMLVNKPSDQTATFLVKGITKLHQKILTLLKVPWGKYDIHNLDWWKFNPI